MRFAEGGFVEVPPSRIPVVAETDVLVAGGGSAGLSAAVAAARNGAGVILLERFGYLGGLATGGLIILLLTLDDGAGHQIVGGICQEMVDRMERLGGVRYPQKSEWDNPDPRLVETYRRWGLVWGGGPHRVRYSVAFDPHQFIFAADQMIREAGVRVLYNSVVYEPVLEGSTIRGVIVQNKSGMQAIRAKVVIDATGDGDIFAAAGEPFAVERVHPWLWFLMSGVTESEKAFESGAGLFFHTIGHGRFLVPWGGEGRVARRVDATNADEVSAALAECREMVRAEVARLKSSVPGFKDAYLSMMADQLGIAESRRLEGEYVMVRDDLARSFDDTIARTGHWTKYDCVYNIPYRSLVPRGVTNLLAAGRCISVDHRVHHATKEIPSCMATGQAAGTAAALAAAGGTPVREIDVRALQRRLREQGALLE